MFRLPPTAHRDSVLAMAKATDGGGYFGKIPEGWITGTVTQLKRAGATSIKKANVRVVRTYL